MNTPVYLDNNATTPTDRRVVDAMLPIFCEHFGNPSSTTHTFGWYAEELVRLAREQVAKLINADADEIYFTSGATESNNLVILGSMGTAKDSGRSYLSARTEHKAILDPLERMERSGIAVSFLGVGADGRLDSSQVESAFQNRPFLASLMLANNEIGVIHDVEQIARLAASDSILLHTDATQAVGKVPVDVRRLGVDFLSLSAHKFYGPKGIGAFYVKRSTGAGMLTPLVCGGGQERGLRSGTPNVPAIVGFGRACEIAHSELEHDTKVINALTTQLLDYLRQHGVDFDLNGAATPRIPGNLNLQLPGIDSTQLIGLVSSKLAISSTSACSSGSAEPSHVLTALGLSPEAQHCCIRIGIGRFNTEEEIEFAGSTLVAAIRKLSGQF